MQVGQQLQQPHMPRPAAVSRADDCIILKASINFHFSLAMVFYHALVAGTLNRAILSFVFRWVNILIVYMLDFITTPQAQ